MENVNESRFYAKRNSSNLFEIKSHKAGILPKALSGSFTSISLANEFILKYENSKLKK